MILLKSWDETYDVFRRRCLAYAIPNKRLLISPHSSTRFAQKMPQEMGQWRTFLLVVYLPDV